MKPDTRKTKKELIDELEILRKKINLQEKAVASEIVNIKELESNEHSILLNAAIKLGSTLDLNAVMQNTTDQITNLAGIETSAVYLVNGDNLYLGATTPPLNSSMPEEFRFAKLDDHTHIKKCVTAKQIVTVSDSKNEIFSPREKIILEQRKFKSILYVPISITSGTIGVFIAASLDKIKTCTSKELDLFRALSNIVAIALQNSLLHKELEEKNEELSTTLLSIGDAVISTDIEGNIVLMNKNAERLCGYDLKEAVGKPLRQVFKIISSTTREEIENPIKEVIDGGKRVHLANHTILISKGGTEYQIADSAAPILDSKGKITGVVLVFSDVTEDYALREELKANKDKLNRAELMGEFGHWELDLVNKKISGSPGAAAIYGIEGELFDLSIIQKTPLPEYRQLLDESMFKLINENKPYNIEFEIKRPDGVTRVVHSSAIFDSINKKVFGILHDITKRKQAEKSLKKSEMNYREFFMKDLTGDFLSTMEGKIVDCNPAFLSTLGYSYYEEIKNFDASCFYADKNERDNLIKIIKKEREITSHEIKMKKSNGEIITVLENVIGIFDDKNKLTHLRGYIFDITDRKKAENIIIKAKERAEAADRLKTEFLAQMSHEIRSPLNAVLSFTELIKEITSDTKCDELDACYSGISSASKRIIRTVDSILNMSDLHLGTYQAAKRKVNIVDLLKSIILEFGNTANYKNIELRFDTNIEKKILSIDDYALGQILVNLLDNAIKYTRKGFVEVQLIKNDNFTIKVKDTGIGISKEYLPTLFTPFTQEEQGYTRSYDGNGLGLALVKKYCEILKADISVDSKKNVGTTFTIDFPGLQ